MTRMPRTWSARSARPKCRPRQRVMHASGRRSTVASRRTACRAIGVVAGPAARGWRRRSPARPAAPASAGEFGCAEPASTRRARRESAARSADSENDVNMKFLLPLVGRQLTPTRPAEQRNQAEDHRERVVIQITGLQPAHRRRTAMQPGRRAVDADAVDDPRIAALPEPRPSALPPRANNAYWSSSIQYLRSSTVHSGFSARLTLVGQGRIEQPDVGADDKAASTSRNGNCVKPCSPSPAGHGTRREFSQHVVPSATGSRCQTSCRTAPDRS